MRTVIPRSDGRPLALALVLLSTPASASAQPEPQAPFSGVTQVTAHELVMGFPPLTAKRPLLLAKPPALDAADILLELDGERLLPAGLTRASERSWHFLLYVDLLLSAPRQVRWQAETVLAELENVLELGALEIVVAGPEPARFLAPTRDESVAREALSRLALTTSAPDHVERLRQDFVRALTAADLGMPLTVFASEVLAEEGRIARNRMDRLLTYLAEDARELRAPKVLLFAPGALDLVPVEFYAEVLGPAGLEVDGRTDLTQVADALARNVAALGWATVGLDGPEPEKVLLEGWRIGKWRFKKPVVGDLWFEIVHEAERDPELAEAHLELSESLLAAGKAAEARAAFEKAIHHFLRDPRTADRQAIAWRGLGEALDLLGEPEAALRAFKTAAKLNPEAVPQYAPLVAEEASARSLLDRFERAGLGWSVRGGTDLGDVLLSLRRVLILTYQTEDPHDGTLHRLVASRQPTEGGDGASDPTLIASTWSASGTSEGIAAARLRRFLEDAELEVGDLEAGLELREEAERLELEIRVDGGPAPTIRLRASVGVATPRGVEVRHLLAERVGETATWRAVLPLSGRPSGPLVAMVEDLASGEWTVGWFDL